MPPNRAHRSLSPNVLERAVTCGTVGVALALLSPVAHAQRLDLPEPEAPPPRDIRENGPSPMYYRLRPDTVGPMLRTGLGTSIRLGTEGEESGGAFALDILGGVAFGFGRGARGALAVEGGYSYIGFSEHWALIGLGPMIRRFGPEVLDSPDDGRPQGDLSIALIPHGMFGSLQGETAKGIRTSLVVQLWLYGIELAHQVATTDDREVHEIHAVLSLMSLTGDEL